MPKERKTHCHRGHAFAGDNLRVHRRGKYVVHKCRACERHYERVRTYRIREKGTRHDRDDETRHL